ncbi:MAG TPA: hypothetical protein PLB89_13205 [Flavobacteriales bacterium]|nr:hypothetical protein [Flavobacteriales bacterium]
MKHAMVVSIGMLWSMGSLSQPPAIPAWMQDSFAEGATSTLPFVPQGVVKHNTFIGSYTAQLTIHDTTDSITQRLYLSAWQDSTRGIMQLELLRGIPHTTWFADIAANVAVVANAIGRKAMVSELKDVLLIDRLREPGKIREFAPLHLEATGKHEEIAGVPCVQYDLIEARDTMDIWTADISPSPFADGPAWIPMNEGPLKTFRLLFKFGDLVAFRFALQPLLELEVTEFHAGPSAPPAIVLHNYTVGVTSPPTAPDKP